MRSRLSAALARLVLTLVDPFAVVVAALLVLPRPEPGPVALAALVALLVCRGAGLHRSRLVVSVVADLPTLLLAALALTLALGVGVDLRDASPARVVLLGGESFAAMVLLRTAVHAATRVLRRAGVIAHPVLVVGAGATARRLAEALLLRREHGLVPVGHVDPGEAAHGMPVPRVGGTGGLDQAMLDLGVDHVDHVVLALPGPPDHDTRVALGRCVRRGHQVFVASRLDELVSLDGRTERVLDVAVVRLHRHAAGRSSRALRRAVDVAVSSGGLLLLSPVLVLVALAVRVETGPGVLARQTRVTGDGSTLAPLRFRSRRPTRLEVDATTWSTGDVTRAGPVGGFLRSTGLDELPQLLDVVAGRASLFGPPSEPSGHPAAVDPSGPEGPSHHVDDLTREHWSWREDLRLGLRALRVAVVRRRPHVDPSDLTAPREGAGPPPAGGRSATGRALHGSRRG